MKHNVTQIPANTACTRSAWGQCGVCASVTGGDGFVGVPAVHKPAVHKVHKPAVHKPAVHKPAVQARGSQAPGIWMAAEVFTTRHQTHLDTPT